MRKTRVASENRTYGGKIGSCTVATNGDTLRIAAQLVDMPTHPGQGFESIFDTRRKLVLRRQAIVHGNDETIGLERKLATNGVVAVETADHVSATV